MQYIDTNGNVTHNLTSDEAMAKFAAHGFTGRITDDPRDTDTLTDTAEDLGVDVDTDTDTDADTDIDTLTSMPTMPAVTEALAAPAWLAYVAPTPNKRTMATAAADIAEAEAIVTVVCGVAAPPPWFAPGTEMITMGKDKFKSLARGHDDMPAAEDAIHMMMDRIRAENRQSVQVTGPELRVWADHNHLYMAKGDTEPFAVEESLLRDLGRMAPKAFRGGGSLLTSLSPHTAADVLSEVLPRMMRTVQIRTRQVEGHRQAFAVVGPAYPTGGDADMWLSAALPILKGQGMKGSITYNPVSTEVEARFTWSAAESYDAKVGDFFRAGWQGRSRDNGTGAFRGGGYALRIVCINCTTAHVEGDDDFRRVHKGAAIDFTGAIVNSLTSAQNGFRPFLRMWGIARQEGALEAMATYTGEAPEDMYGALTSLATKGGFDGIPTDMLTTELHKAYDREPGDGSVADMLNAVTRAAHEAPWDDLMRRIAEERAGELMYALLPGQMM